MTWKILVVGAGITGAITGSLLRKLYPGKCYLVIWEQAKGIGGRMNTRKNPYDCNCFVEFGAQYITLSEENLIKHKEIYEALLVKKLLEPLHINIEGMKELPIGTKHFTAVNGMSSLVEHFLDGVADEIHFERCVTKISTKEKQLVVQTKCGAVDIFNIVILTIPVPQLLELAGSVQEIVCKNPEMEHNLKSVKFSSRFAMGLFFNSNYHLNVDWGSKYIYDDSVFRYVSLGSQNRSKANGHSAAILHTSVQYGEDNVDRDLNDIRNELVEHVKKLFPKWPEPAYIECHKWPYSQVVTPYSGQPGCITLSEDPKIIAGGDSFTSSHIDDCILSAISLVKAVDGDMKTSL